MTKRMALLFTLILSLVILPGCPAVSALVGVWTFTTFTDIGINLMADGTATSFASPGILLGDLTWEASGSEFIMRIDIGQDDLMYVGHIESDTTMNGAYVFWDGGSQGQSGVWTAVKQ